MSPLLETHNGVQDYPYLVRNLGASESLHQRFSEGSSRAVFVSYEGLGRGVRHLSVHIV